MLVISLNIPLLFTEIIIKSIMRLSICIFINIIKIRIFVKYRNFMILSILLITSITLVIDINVDDTYTNFSENENNLTLSDHNSYTSHHIPNFDKNAQLITAVNDSNTFISIWNTTLPDNSLDNKTIRLPIHDLDARPCDVEVNWGDGNTETIDDCADNNQKTHTYDQPGMYNITIRGDIPIFRFGSIDGGPSQAVSVLKIIEIVQWGNLPIQRASFVNAENLVLTTTDAPEIIGDSLRYLFTNAGNLGNYSNLNSWDVSSITDMKELFRCYNGKSCIIGDQFNGNISSWDVSSVTIMSHMFAGMKNLKLDLNAWNVSSVTNMDYMFHSGFSLESSYVNISEWDVSSVTDMSYMFTTTNYFDFNISKWDVSSVTTMASMFATAYGFNQDIGDWNVSSVTDMRFMFNQAYLFNQDIGDWNVSSVTDMRFMFARSNFNQDISNWDVSSVTNMDYMFGSYFGSIDPEDPFHYQLPNYNQDMSTWNVSSVTSMQGMFMNNIHFNQSLDNWDVSSVTNMEKMFCNATSFDEDISTWNMSKVENMKNMFCSANTFSAPNYDKLLISLANQTLQDEVELNVNAYYSIDAYSARESIIENYNWTINDLGLFIPTETVTVTESTNNTETLTETVTSTNNQNTTITETEAGNENNTVTEISTLISTIMNTVGENNGNSTNTVIENNTPDLTSAFSNPNWLILVAAVGAAEIIRRRVS